MNPLRSLRQSQKPERKVYLAREGHRALLASVTQLKTTPKSPGCLEILAWTSTS